MRRMWAEFVPFSGRGQRLAADAPTEPHATTEPVPNATTELMPDATVEPIPDSRVFSVPASWLEERPDLGTPNGLEGALATDLERMSFPAEQPDPAAALVDWPDDTAQQDGADGEATWARLIQIHDDLADLGIVLQAAALRIGHHRYLSPLLRELDNLMEAIGTTTSFVSTSLEMSSDVLTLRTVQTARGLASEIMRTWSRVKPDVDLMIERMPKKTIAASSVEEIDSDDDNDNDNANGNEAGHGDDGNPNYIANKTAWMADFPP